MRLGDRPYLRPRSSAVMLIYGSITPQLVQTEARSSLIRELRLWSWELRQHADVCGCVSMRGCVCAFNIGLNFLRFLLLSKHGTQWGQERAKFPDCLWTSSDRTIIICFVHSDACILQSLTRIKPLPMSEPCRTGGSEEGGEREKDGGEKKKKKLNTGNKAGSALCTDISQLHAFSSSAISMLITEKSLSDLCAPCSCLSPVCLSLCPTRGSQERSSLCCTGHLFTWKKTSRTMRLKLYKILHI